MAALDPQAITAADEKEEVAFFPIIEEILRTRYCTAGSVFIVEGIDHVPMSSTGRWQMIRLLLGDGELCLQALLSTECHRFIHTEEIFVGCYVKVLKFELELRENDAFLMVHGLKTVGWNEGYRALAEQQTEPSYSQKSSENYGSADAPEAVEVAEPPAPTASTEDLGDSDLDDAFEQLAAPEPQDFKQAPIVKLAKDWTDYRIPLKLTTLHAIPHLPYSQNWSCNVLAIVTSLSQVEPSYLPPYRQRTARIADPSTAKQIHLSIFLDPEAFNPTVGSAVLLTGVKNHRFDGGSLKKYASDKGKGPWWFQDPWEMTWCDVAGIKYWWTQMEAATGGSI